MVTRRSSQTYLPDDFAALAKTHRIKQSHDEGFCHSDVKVPDVPGDINIVEKTESNKYVDNVNSENQHELSRVSRFRTLHS